MTIRFEYLVPPQEIEGMLDSAGEVIFSDTVDADTVQLDYTSGMSMQFDFQAINTNLINLTDMRFYSEAGELVIDISGFNLEISETSSAEELTAQLLGENYHLQLTDQSDILRLNQQEDELYESDDLEVSAIMDGGAGYDAVIVEDAFLDLIHTAGETSSIAGYQIDGEQFIATYEDGASVTIDLSSERIELSGESGGDQYSIVKDESGSVISITNSTGVVSEVRNFEAVLFSDYLLPLQDFAFFVDEDSLYQYDYHSILNLLGTGSGFSYSAAQADGTALPDWLSLNAATGVLSGTPENEDVGVYEINLQGGDGAHSIATSTLLIVHNQNDAPVVMADLLNLIARYDSDFEYQIPSDTFADIDNDDALTLTATQADGSVLPQWLQFDPQSGTFSGTPQGGEGSSLEIRVTATDSASASVSDTFTVNFSSGVTDDPLKGLLAINNGAEYDTARWNFALADGTPMGQPGGIGSSATVTYSFPSTLPDYYQQPENSAHLPTGFESFEQQQRDAVRSVLEHYSEIVDVTFVESEADGQITFAFSEQYLYTAGYAYYPSSTYYYDGSSTISDIEEDPIGGDVWINSTPKDGWLANDFLPGGEGYSTLLHEMGHAMGLKHSFLEGGDLYQLSDGLDHTGYTVMAYDPPANSTMVEVEGSNQEGFSILSYSIPNEGLMVGDVAALQYLYGANQTTRSGDDSYQWGESELFFETLWDGGGLDTIDCSNQTYGCSIDLTPGAYSSVALRTTQSEALNAMGLGDYDWLPESLSQEVLDDLYNGSNNLSIAEGVVIENVVGGRGDDIFTGNSADNSIDGGLGDDTVIFSHAYADYSVTPLGSGWSIYHALEGRDQLTSIESLQFSDQRVSVSQLQAEESVGLSGTVSHWASAAPMSEVSVSLAGNSTQLNRETTTASDGAFSFGEADLSQGASLQLSKTTGTDSDSAVDLQDAILILKQIVGLETLNAYQEIAADFDQSGATDLNDAIGVLKHVVDLPATNPEWHFVESGSDPVVSESIQFAADSSQPVELVGVLTGDVDGSWQATV